MSQNTPWMTWSRSVACILGILLLLAAPVSAQTTGSVIQFGTIQMFDDSGDPCSLCILEFYAATTSTPITIYTTSALSVSASNPYTLDASGRGTIWLGTQAYKVIYKTAAGVPIWTLDNIPGAAAGGNAFAVSSIASDYTATLTDNLLLVSGTRTITLPTAVGNTGKSYVVKNVATGTVTLDGNGSQTIESLTTWVLPVSQESIQIVSDGSNWRVINYQEPKTGVCECRLTLTTLVPVTTTDVTAAGTIYLTPFSGNKISLFDGSQWHLHPFTELSLALTATSGFNYDVFVYNNAGTLTLETAIWASDTARTTALVRQNGVLVKTGALTRLYVGTFRASGSNVAEDSNAKRFLWNYYNRVSTPMRVLESANSWTWTTATFQQANASAANQLALVVGVAEEAIQVDVLAHVSNSSAASVYVGIGEDSTTAIATGTQNNGLSIDADVVGAIQSVRSSLRTIPAVGYHFYAWLETSQAAGTTTWYGDNNTPLFLQSGISALWRR